MSRGDDGGSGGDVTVGITSWQELLQGPAPPGEVGTLSLAVPVEDGDGDGMTWAVGMVPPPPTPWAEHC